MQGDASEINAAALVGTCHSLQYGFKRPLRAQLRTFGLSRCDPGSCRSFMLCRMTANLW